DEGSHLVAVRNVDADAIDLVVRAQCGHDLVDYFLANVGSENAGAFGQEASDTCRANPAAGTRHHDRLAIKALHQLNSFWSSFAASASRASVLSRRPDEVNEF